MSKTSSTSYLHGRGETRNKWWVTSSDVPPQGSEGLSSRRVSTSDPGFTTYSTDVSWLVTLSSVDARHEPCLVRKLSSAFEISEIVDEWVNNCD